MFYNKVSPKCHRGNFHLSRKGCGKIQDGRNFESSIIRDHYHIYLLLWIWISPFKQINELPFPIKSSVNLWFFVDFRGNRA